MPYYHKNMIKSVENDNLCVLENTFTETKVCTVCNKTLPIQQFKGEKVPVTKTCLYCRENGKKSDKNRNKEHRNEIARKNDAKPERKAVKAKWTEDNYDNAAKRWMDYRQRQIEKLGPDEYLKKQAENAKKWRDNNPEKMAKINENKKNSKEQNYNIYKRSADLKNVEFRLTYDQYLLVIEKECHYCGIIQEKGFNGIDRKDQTKGYIFDNCVSCCKMCNYMKGSTSDQVFINRVEHILTYQGRINNGSLYPFCFANHQSTPLEGYKKRALAKELDFTITQEDYINLINGSCFVCGKITNGEHTNGIDRLENDKGYIIDNVKSCCGECNYIKKDFRFDEMIDKFVLIYEKHKDQIKNTSETKKNDNKTIIKTNKKSKEEIAENSLERKHKKKIDLIARYNDEEYKNARAAELARLRNETR
jgi:hypothetical protein